MKVLIFLVATLVASTFSLGPSKSSDTAEQVITRVQRQRRGGGGGGGGGGGDGEGSAGLPGLPGGSGIGGLGLSGLPGRPGGHSSETPAVPRVPSDLELQLLSHLFNSNPHPSDSPTDLTEVEKTCKSALDMNIPSDGQFNMVKLLLKLAEAGHIECAKAIAKLFGMS